MNHNNPDTNFFHLHYTPHRKYSIGYKLEQYNQRHLRLHLAQFNTLLQRYNTRNSQANAYLKTALGFTDKHQSDLKNQPAGFAEIAIDWETQRHFFSYSVRHTHAKNFFKTTTHTSRVGIAPYIGAYGDLHTWLMLEVTYDADDDQHLRFRPLIRFFKGTRLFEIGYVEGKGLLWNHIIRF